MGAFFFILTLVALIGVLVNRKKIPNYGVVAGGLAGLALVLSLFRLTSGSQVHPDLRAPPVYELSVGHALGKAAVKAFPGGGDLLVIRLRFDKSWARDKADAYVEGLERGIEGSSLRNAGVEPESIFPGAAGGMDDPDIPMDDLLALLEQYPDVVAVVSFCGFPKVSLKDLPDHVPPLLVAGTHSFRHGRWLTSRRAVAMVMGRPDIEGDIDLSRKQPLEEVFASLNYLLTPDNVEEMAHKVRN